VARGPIEVCRGSSPISSLTSTLVSSVVTTHGGGDGLLHLRHAHRPIDPGAVAQQILRLVLRGHQHQAPLAVDARLQPSPGSQAEDFPQPPGNGELALEERVTVVIAPR